MALTVTPTNATIYMLNANGIASSQHAYPHVVQTFNGTTLIGGDSVAANRTFLGNIDDVAVFNKALTCDQLSAMFYAASGLTNYAPIIVTPLASQSVYVGQSATFTVVGGGSQPLTYQWQADTGSGFTNINNGGQFSGANGSDADHQWHNRRQCRELSGHPQSNAWGTINSSSIGAANFDGQCDQRSADEHHAVRAAGRWGRIGIRRAVGMMAKEVFRLLFPLRSFPAAPMNCCAGSRLRTTGNQLNVHVSGCSTDCGWQRSLG